jgi:CheY-like chemotaxis protein
MLGIAGNNESPPIPTEDDTMPKLVLDVGNCGPDHSAIKRLIEKGFDAQVLQSHGAEDTVALLLAHKIDLVLVNRKLDQDYTDGLDIIKMIKARPEFSALPVMMITNYPDHQQLAVEAGALYGFGKLQFNAPETREKLHTVLGA